MIGCTTSSHLSVEHRLQHFGFVEHMLDPAAAAI
jgi:hypothetical protein